MKKLLSTALLGISMLSPIQAMNQSSEYNYNFCDFSQHNLQELNQNNKTVKELFCRLSEQLHKKETPEIELNATAKKLSLALLESRKNYWKKYKGPKPLHYANDIYPDLSPKQVLNQVIVVPECRPSQKGSERTLGITENIFAQSNIKIGHSSGDCFLFLLLHELTHVEQNTNTSFLDRYVYDIFGVDLFKSKYGSQKGLLPGETFSNEVAQKLYQALQNDSLKNIKECIKVLNPESIINSKTYETLKSAKNILGAELLNKLDSTVLTNYHDNTPIALCNRKILEREGHIEVVAQLKKLQEIKEKLSLAAEKEIARLFASIFKLGSDEQIKSLLNKNAESEADFHATLFYPNPVIASKAQLGSGPQERGYDPDRSKTAQTFYQSYYTENLKQKELDDEEEGILKNHFFKSELAISKWQQIENPETIEQLKKEFSSLEKRSFIYKALLVTNISTFSFILYKTYPAWSKYLWSWWARKK